MIDWEAVIAEGRHPADTSPPGCRLTEFVLQHPRSTEVAAALGRVGMNEPTVQEVRVSSAHARETESAREKRSVVVVGWCCQAAEVGMWAKLDTPKGSFVLRQYGQQLPPHGHRL